MNIRYTPYSIEHRDELFSMIHHLYHEETEGEPMYDEKIKATIQFLTDNAQRGKILVFKDEELVVGYSILVYYWSNEFGGEIVFIDELYLKPEYRSRSIGTDFLQYIVQASQAKFKAIFLEVFPSNEKAFRFYTRNGFVRIESRFLKYTL